MSRLAACPQGHQWTVPAEETGTAPGVSLLCPVCGADPVTREAPPDCTLDYAPAAAPASWKAVAAPPDYEILGELGRGGMGVVYKAYHRPLKRLVALKMILAGASASPEIFQRFRTEAEACARLQHPNIVQIHEVGWIEAWRPYFSLEYLEGGSLARRLAGVPQPPRKAAEWMAVLAHAVHFAHQRGVLHRDLKPANVLVAADGTLKISDFGLARQLAVEGGATAPEGPTATGAVLGTPNYMPPEQASGVTRTPTPAVDVYALGAVLYEMLTGRPPFLGPSAVETTLLVMTREPPPPRRLQPTVPRDLETICLKCLQKEPRRRYPGADALADDLERYLAGRPIRARPVGWWERGVKWARRRPTAAALVAVCVAGVLAGLAGILWYNAHLRAERDRAEANFQTALQAVDELLTDVGEEQLAYEPRMERKRRALLAKALTFSQRLLEQKGDEPVYRSRMALAYKRVGDIQRLLGQPEEARQAYTAAVALLERLHAEEPGNVDHRRNLAACDNFLGEVLRAAGLDTEAEAAYLRAADLQERLLADFRDGATCRQDLAQTRYNLGILYTETDRPGDAETALNRAAELLERLVAEDAGPPAYRQHLARAYLNRGPVRRAANRPGDAEADYDKAIALLTALAKENPDDPDYRHEQGVASNNLGNLLAEEGLWDRAKAAHAGARDLFVDLTRDFPQTPAYRRELANTLNSYGKALAATDGLGAADAAWAQAREELERLIRDNPASAAAYQGDLGLTLGNQGWSLAKRGAWQDARPLLEQAVAKLIAARAAEPRNPVYRAGLREQYRNLAETLLQLKDHAAAADAARALPTLFPDSGKDAYLAACFLARCAAVAASDNRLPEKDRARIAREDADASLALLSDAARKGSPLREPLTDEQQGIFQALRDDPRFQELTRRYPPASAP